MAEQSYVYSPSSAHAAKIVEELSVLYKIRRVTIITLIYSKPSEQIRDFSDAFRFKKDEEDENG